MADTRTLTKRKFRIEEPNSYGANYVVRAIKYEPLFKNIRGEVIYEAGYYLDLSPQKLELRQDGLILSSGTYDVFRGIPGRELVFLMPASRFNAKTAEKVVEQYKGISYVQEYCDRHGLTLATSDPDDERVNDSGFNWEHRTGGIYRYHNMDVKEREYSLNYRGQSIYGIKDRDIPRSMRANLSKGEGMPVGGMTLMRTQDRKPMSSFRELGPGESAPKEELMGRFVECLNRIRQERMREVFTEDEIVITSSIEYHLLRPSEARMMVRDAIAKGYLIKRGDFIRATEKFCNFETGMFFVPEAKKKPKMKAPAKKCVSKCTKPMVKSIPKKPAKKPASKDCKPKAKKAAPKRK